MSRSRSRSIKVSAATENELKRIVSSPENANKCGECRASYPTWCSVNLGVMLCGRCASVHRKLLGFRDEGVYSYIKSLSMDRWSSAEIDDVSHSGGNKRNNKVWNAKGVPFPFDADEDKSMVEQFIRDKYILAKFRYDPVEPHEYGNNGVGYMPEGIRPRSRSRTSSGSIGTLSSAGRVRSRSVGGSGYGSPVEGTMRMVNRKAKDYELSRYARELRILRDRGYPSIDNNAEALSMARGDVSRAMTILDRNVPSLNGKNRSSSSIGGYDDDDYGRRSNRLVPPPFQSSSARTASMSAADASPRADVQDGLTAHLTEQKPNLPRRRATTTGPQPAVFDGTDGGGDLLLATLTGAAWQPQTQPQPAIFDGTTGMSGSSAGVFDGNAGASVQQFLDPVTGIIYVDQNEMAFAQQQQQQQQQEQEQLQRQAQQAQQAQQEQFQHQMLQQQRQQEFLQQQQQQQQMLQQQMYLQQQQTNQPQVDKNALMSLYQHPDVYSTPVEVREDHPQYNQIMQLQQQQQQQAQQQHQLMQMQMTQGQQQYPMYQGYWS